MLSILVFFLWIYNFFTKYLSYNPLKKNTNNLIVEVVTRFIGYLCHYEVIYILLSLATGIYFNKPFVLWIYTPILIIGLAIKILLNKNLQKKNSEIELNKQQIKKSFYSQRIKISFATLAIILIINFIINVWISFFCSLGLNFSIYNKPIFVWYYTIAPLLSIFIFPFFITNKKILTTWFQSVIIFMIIIALFNITYPNLNLHWLRWTNKSYINMDLTSIPIGLFLISLHYIYLDSQVTALIFLFCSAFFLKNSITLNLITEYQIITNVTIYLLSTNFDIYKFFISPKTAINFYLTLKKNIKQKHIYYIASNNLIITLSVSMLSNIQSFKEIFIILSITVLFTIIYFFKIYLINKNIYTYSMFYFVLIATSLSIMKSQSIKIYDFLLSNIVALPIIIGINTLFNNKTKISFLSKKIFYHILTNAVASIILLGQVLCRARIHTILATYFTVYAISSAISKFLINEQENSVHSIYVYSFYLFQVFLSFILLAIRSKHISVDYSFNKYTLIISSIIPTMTIVIIKLSSKFYKSAQQYATKDL